MSQKILVQYTIPLNNYEIDGPYILFYKWIPKNIDEALIRVEGDITTRLWVDRSCIMRLGEFDDAEIDNWNNITVNKVLVSIEIANVSDELVQFIYDERDGPMGVHYGVKPAHEDYKRLKEAYSELGKTVLQEAFTIFNRLISFTRNYKDQFWLNERQINFDQLTSFNNLFGAQVKLPEFDWIRWCPHAQIIIRVVLPDEKKSIHPEGWTEIQEYISANSKPDFILELLANADLFISEKRRRTAIVEAITALEIAVARFADDPKLHEIRTSEDLVRLNITNLKAQISHMGFSGTVGFLLPILFPVEIFPSTILADCQNAIGIRNTIIHNGRRDVDHEVARPLILSVRKACGILDLYTDRP